jgi:hypothetical protein
MPLMKSVCVVEAEDAPLIDSGKMGKKKGEIVSNDLIYIVYPNLLAQNAGAASASKSSFVIGIFTKADVPAHEDTLGQMMHREQHLHPHSSNGDIP